MGLEIVSLQMGSPQMATLQIAIPRGHAPQQMASPRAQDPQQTAGSSG